MILNLPPPIKPIVRLPNNKSLGSLTIKSWRDFVADDCKFSAEMAAHHVAAWEWLQALEPGKSATPMVICWARGGGKTSTVRAGIAFVAHRSSRKFAWYVCATQTKANENIQGIRQQLSKMGMERKVDKYGSSQGWNASTIRVSNDFSVVGIGLDVAARGMLLEGDRPDLIVFDDIDSHLDTPDAVAKKIETITLSILPAGSADSAVIFLQNAIHAKSIMSQFVKKRNTFLLGASVFGPYPAADNLIVDQDDSGIYKVVGGTALWAGQSLPIIEGQINRYGLRAFLRESQHEVYDDIAGALWTRDVLNRCQVRGHPRLTRLVCGVDHAVTSDPTRSDKSGLILAGLGIDDHIYILRNYSGHFNPHKLAENVMKIYGICRADAFVYETNNGGDFVAATLRSMDASLPIVGMHVHQAKEVRAGELSVWYEDLRVHHVLTQDGEGEDAPWVNPMADLEDEMLSWVPDGRSKSPNMIDAAVLAFKYLSPFVTNQVRVIDRRVAPRRS